MFADGSSESGGLDDQDVARDLVQNMLSGVCDEFARAARAGDGAHDENAGSHLSRDASELEADTARAQAAVPGSNTDTGHEPHKRGPQEPLDCNSTRPGVSPDYVKLVKVGLWRSGTHDMRATHRAVGMRAVFRPPTTADRAPQS